MGHKGSFPRGRDLLFCFSVRAFYRLSILQTNCILEERPIRYTTQLYSIYFLALAAIIKLRLCSLEYGSLTVYFLPLKTQLGKTDGIHKTSFKLALGTRVRLAEKDVRTKFNIALLCRYVDLTSTFLCVLTRINAVFVLSLFGNSYLKNVNKARVTSAYGFKFTSSL